MERYQVGERQAFAVLRDHARHSGQKLVLVAQAVLDGHLLLSSTARPSPDGTGTTARIERGEPTE